MRRAGLGRIETKGREQRHCQHGWGYTRFDRHDESSLIDGLESKGQIASPELISQSRTSPMTVYPIPPTDNLTEYYKT